MYLNDLSNPFPSTPELQLIIQTLNQSLFDQNIIQLNSQQLSIVRRNVSQLLLYNKTLEQIIQRKQNIIKDYEKELQSKDSIITFLDNAKKQIQQSVQQIVGYNHHYLQIIRAKDQEIEELLNKTQNNRSLQEGESIEQVYHYDISNDFNTNLVHWDFINQKQKKYRKFPRKEQDKVSRENKSRSKKSVLEEVKKYITNTQEKFRKSDRYSVKNKYQYPNF